MLPKANPLFFSGLIIMIIRNHTTKISGSLTGLPDFFCHQLKIIGKMFGGYNQNDYLCGAFIK